MMFAYKGVSGLHFFFRPVKLPGKVFMAASLPEASAFSQIRKALKRVLSASVEFEMSLV